MRARSLLSLAVLVASATLARAGAPAGAPGGWVGARVLPTGQVEVAVVHELLLTTYRINPDELGDPWATGVDLAIAARPGLTLGLSHSARAQGTVDRGGGWCHDDRSHRCSRAYAGGLLDARWRLRDTEGLAVAALGRLGAIGLGPMRPVVRLGLSARAGRGRWWAVVEPEVQVSLGHRELGSRDTLIAPVWLGVGQRRAAAWLQTGLRGQLVGFGEKLEIPLVLGAAVQVSRLRAGVEVGWPKLAGPVNTGNVRHAALWLAASL